MASIKKDTLNRSPQWWKHLKEWKRVFWKRERQSYKKVIDTQSSQGERRD